MKTKLDRLKAARKSIICKSHITRLNKVAVALAYKQTMDNTHLILSEKNVIKFEKANNLIHDAIAILHTVE